MHIIRPFPVLWVALGSMPPLHHTTPYIKINRISVFYTLAGDVRRAVCRCGCMSACVCVLLRVSMCCRNRTRTGHVWQLCGVCIARTCIAYHTRACESNVGCRSIEWAAGWGVGAVDDISRSAGIPEQQCQFRGVTYASLYAQHIRVVGGFGGGWFWDGRSLARLVRAPSSLASRHA